MTTQSKRGSRSTQPNSAAPTGAARGDVLQDYAKACRDRDRFSLRKRSAEKRQQDFMLALKHMAKQVAHDATVHIDNRHDRTAVRASVYSRLAELMTCMEQDRRVTRVRAQRRGQWVLGTAAVFLTVTAVILVSQSTGLIA